MPHRIAFALIVALFVIAPTFAADPKQDDKKDDPGLLYTSWARYKPGTTVMLSGSQSQGEESAEMSLTLKLVEVKDKDGVLVFEVETSVTKGGKTEKQPAAKLEVKKGEGLMGLPTTLDKKTGKPTDAVEEGTEKVKVGGTEYECKWYKTQAKAPGGAVTEGKVWVCESFPGYLIRMAGQFRDVKADFGVTAVTIQK